MGGMSCVRAFSPSNPKSTLNTSAPSRVVNAIVNTWPRFGAPSTNARSVCASFNTRSRPRSVGSTERSSHTSPRPSRRTRASAVREEVSAMDVHLPRHLHVDVTRDVELQVALGGDVHPLRRLDRDGAVLVDLDDRVGVLVLDHHRVVIAGFRRARAGTIQAVPTDLDPQLAHL